MPKHRHSFVYRNSLAIVLACVAVACIGGQAFTGWKQYNDEALERRWPLLQFGEYLGSSHFQEAMFENWESEFLQMGMYVLFTVFLRQRGSAESKPLDGKADVDREPMPSPDAPWPVRKGGGWLKLYSNSLSLAFLCLFLVSFVLHVYGSHRVYQREQAHKGGHIDSLVEYLGNSKLWFESLQNWQSEFVAVLAIVLLSIFLRQKGSPESKPVDAPNSSNQ